MYKKSWVLAAVLSLGSSAAFPLATGSRIPWNCGNYFLTGANYPWSWYGADVGGPNLSTFSTDFTNINAQGGRVVRWWLFGNGWQNPLPVGASPTGLTSGFMTNMQSILDLAASKNVYIEWSILDFGLFDAGDGTERIVTDPAYRQAFLDNVLKPILQTFGQHPNILSWDAMNEPEWAIRAADGGGGNTATTATLAQMRDYVNAVANYVHLYSRHYATVGSASLKWVKVDYQFWTGLNIDYYEAHYYSWMNPWYDPVGNRTYASLGLDKPCVIGESPANGGGTGYTPAQIYTGVYNNGYAGLLPWSWKGVDTAGGPADFQAAMLSFYNAHTAEANIQPCAATSTFTRTFTPVPPTSTPTRTFTPAAFTNTFTRTFTPVPPTFTPTSTFTPIPGTFTFTRTYTPTVPAGTGTGLQGAYYDNSDLTTLRVTRTDATVNFNWGTGTPAPNVAADTFSVRWSGQVQPAFSQTYTFYTQSDDGVRLWVNGVQLVNNWTNHASTENSGTISLTAGQKYNLTMEFYDNTGGAVAMLSWSSASQAKQIIPQNRLYLPVTATSTPTRTFTPAPPTATPTATSCAFLLNGCDTLAQNGTWSAPNATLAVVTSAPAGAIVQGTGALESTITTALTWQDGFARLSGFTPSAWGSYARFVLRLHLGTGVATGAWKELTLYGDAAGAGKFYQRLSSTIVPLVDGPNKAVFTLNFPDTILATDAISNLILVINSQTGGTGKVYLDNLRLEVSTCTASSGSPVGSGQSFKPGDDSPRPASGDAVFLQAAVVPNPVQGQELRVSYTTGGPSGLLRAQVWTLGGRRVGSLEVDPRNSGLPETLVLAPGRGLDSPLANGTYRLELELSDPMGQPSDRRLLTFFVLK